MPKETQSNSPKKFEELQSEIAGAKSKGKLETLRKAAAKHENKEEATKLLAAINARILEIKDTGAKKAEKAREKGSTAGAQKIEAATTAATKEAEKVKAAAEEEAGKVESKEGKTSKFNAEYTAPELHADKEALVTAAVTEDQETTSESEVVIITPEDLEPGAATSTTPAEAEPVVSNTTPEPTPINTPNEPENPAPTPEGPKNLEEARTAYFAAYKKLEEQTKWKYKAARLFTGANLQEKSEVEKKSEGLNELRKTYTESQSEYRKHLAAEGEKMLAEGKSKAEVEAMIYSELAERQKVLDPIIPEKVKNIAGRAVGWYTRMPKVARIVTSTVIATGIMVGAGKVGLGGAAAYGATRLARAALGGAIGQAIVSLKNLRWNADKSIEKIQEKNAAEFASKIEEAAARNSISENKIEELEKIYQNRLDQERNARIKHLAVDFGIRMIAGLGTGAAMDKTGLTGWIDEKLGGGTHDTDTAHGGKKGGITPPKPAPHPTPDTTPKPENTYTFKEIKVDYSSKGSIDTWAQIKSQLKEAYKGVEDSKVPPEYKYIMTSRADALAKEFGEWKPGEANESLNMLKGSSIEFDKTGKIISHSLRTVSGGTEDQTLMDVKSAGNEPVINQQANERFFHYGGSSANPDDVKAPFQDGTAGPTGIGDQVRAPFGQTDSNGFWNQSGAGKPFESHASSGLDDKPEVGEDFRDHTAWDGKHHSKLWWKHHPDGHDYKAEARLAKKLAKQAAAAQIIQQGVPYQPPYNASQAIDNAFRQTAYNSGGYTNEYPIMNPANPGGAPLEYQHHEVYGAHLSGQQVDRILNNPVRFIGEDFLARASHDPAYPLYKVMHDLQAHGYGFRPNESVAEYFARARTENQAYFAGLNVDFQNWFVRNGFYN